MRILHIITGLNKGGAEGVLYRLCVFDRSQNEHIVISLMDRGVYASRLEEAGVVTHCLGMQRGMISITATFRLYKIIRQLKPDLVQTWLYHANLLGGITAKLARVPAIVWGIRQGNMDADKNKKSTLWTSFLCAKLSYLIPDKIISCSSKATQVHKGLGYHPKKFVDIPNGYSFEIYTPNLDSRIRLREELQLPDDVFVIGTVARFDIQKDHINLLKALSLLRNGGIESFVCLLVGNGMDCHNLYIQEQIRQMDLASHIKLLGQRDDIADIMNTLDLHVLSSSGEAFPNVLAEAMACGTPCVSTNVGDAPLIIGDNGWIVPAKEPDSLFRAIYEAYQLRARSARWNALKLACQKYIASHFGIDKMVGAYRGVWHDCTQNSNITL